MFNSNRHFSLAIRDLLDVTSLIYIHTLPSNASNAAAPTRPTQPVSDKVVLWTPDTRLRITPQQSPVECHLRRTLVRD